MSAERSVQELLSNLEGWEAFHREKTAFHAQQEVYHREQLALHEDELGKVLQKLEAFRSTAAAVVEIAPPPTPEPTPVVAEPKLPSPGRLMVSRLLTLAVKSSDLEEPFSPTALAAEANRRYADRLKEPIGSRTASDVLRRLLAQGEVRRVSKGTAFHEALYARR
ncbi:MAG TPA: hypothetical protein VKK31_07865 [Thermoanaerobaculia bacterium]|nr:hypothetical protein [Thermoanaerobaculia bacterium]